MKVSANTVRKGHVLDHNGKLWLVLKSDIMIPGKGNAVVQVEMRDVRSGIKTNERFRTQETVERAQLTDREMQFLFASGGEFTFMDQQSFEQYVIDRDILGEQALFLQESMVCVVQLHENTPLTVTLPPHVTLEVVEADPVVKGQTASSSYKPAKVSNGARVMVPPFIEVGTRIVVSTADATYVERAKD